MGRDTLIGLLSEASSRIDDIEEAFKLAKLILDDELLELKIEDAHALNQDIKLELDKCA